MKFFADQYQKTCAPVAAKHRLQILFVTVFVLLTGNVAADSQPAYQVLSSTYDKLQKTLLDSQHKYNFHTPLYIHSEVFEGKATGHVYAVLPHSFAAVTHTFESTSGWCNAASLHVNVKTCTTHQTPGQSQVSLYVGEKDYQEPDDAYQIDYQYRNIARSNRYLHTDLNAKSGPLDSKDYLIDIEAIPLDGSTTFIHFSYSAQYGFLSSILMQTYLATAGRNKIGFTQQGTDADGKIIYTNGLKGVIERNAMRYFLAMESYLETATLTGKQRFEASLNRWFEYTEKYSRQLYELNHEEYFSNKVREHANQTALQLVINGPATEQTGTGIPF